MILFNKLISNRDNVRIYYGNDNYDSYLPVQRNNINVYTRSISYKNKIGFRDTNGNLKVDLYDVSYARNQGGKNITSTQVAVSGKMRKKGLWYKNSKIEISTSENCAIIKDSGNSDSYLKPFLNYHQQFSGQSIIIAKDGIYESNGLKKGKKLKSFPKNMKYVYAMIQSAGSGARGNVVYWWVAIILPMWHCYSGGAGGSGSFGIYKFDLSKLEETPSKPISGKFYYNYYILNVGKGGRGGVYQNMQVLSDDCTESEDSYIDVKYDINTSSIKLRLVTLGCGKLGSREVNMLMKQHGLGGKISKTSYFSQFLSVIYETNGFSINDLNSKNDWYIANKGITNAKLLPDESLSPKLNTFKRGNYSNPGGMYGNEYHTCGGAMSVLANGGNATGNANSDPSAHGTYGSGGGSQGTINAYARSGNGGGGYACIGW